MAVIKEYAYSDKELFDILEYLGISTNDVQEMQILINVKVNEIVTITVTQKKQLDKGIINRIKSIRNKYRLELINK